MTCEIMRSCTARRAECVVDICKVTAPTPALPADLSPTPDSALRAESVVDICKVTAPTVCGRSDMVRASFVKGHVDTNLETKFLEADPVVRETTMATVE